MLSPLEIVKLFRLGARIRTDLYVLCAGSARSFAPTKGTVWFLLGGQVGHITGTNTWVFVRNSPDAAVTLAVTDVRNWTWQTFIDSTTPTAVCPIFNNLAEPYSSAYQPVIIDQNSRLWVSGAATAYLKPVVLEVPLEVALKRL